MSELIPIGIHKKNKDDGNGNGLPWTTVNFEFTGSKLFNFSQAVTKIILVKVDNIPLNGAEGAPLQYRLNSPFQLEILDEMIVGEDIWVSVTYNYGTTDEDDPIISIPTFDSIYKGAIVPTSPAPSGSGVATWSATQAGTYTNFGGVVVNANSLATISRNAAGVFAISQTALDLSEANKINIWTAKSYISGSQVNYLGKDWTSNSAIVAGDIPGTSVKWVERLKGYSAFDSPAKNIVNLSAIIEGTVINNSGNIQTGVANSSVILLDCSANTNYTYSGFNITTASLGSRILFLDNTGTKISSTAIPQTTGTFKTPVNCVKFYINTKWAGVSSYGTNQIETGSIATSYEPYSLTKIKGDFIKEDTLDVNRLKNIYLAPAKNLLNTAAIEEGNVINTSGVLQIGAGNFSCIPISCLPNTNYAYSGFNITNASSGCRVLFLDNTGTKISASLVPEISGTFKTPSNCVKFYFNTKWSGTSSYGTSQIEEGSIATTYETYSLSKISRNVIEFPVPALPQVLSSFDGRISSLEISGTPNPFSGKICNFLGDSISTVGSSGATISATNYFNVFGTLIGASLIRTYGVPGNSITGSGGFSDRYSAMDSNADLIVVFGGINDFAGNKVLGTIADTTNTTFYGSLNILMGGLLTKYNAKDIIFMSPMHNVGSQTANSVGLILQDYSKAILECSFKWSIPVLNLTANFGINANKTTGFYPDGVHPNDAGHLRIAKKLVKFTANL